MFDKTLIVSTFHKECGNNKNKNLKEINLSKYQQFSVKLIT